MHERHQHPPTRKERYDNEVARDLERNRLRGAHTGAGYGPAGAWPDGVPTPEDEKLLNPVGEERWGLVVEEPGTGGQCVPDFSRTP